MRKNIVLPNGEVRRMECNEEFLNMYRALAIDTVKKYRKGYTTQLSQDELQELDIDIFKAFMSYDEIHRFSTHLVWKIKSRLGGEITDKKQREKSGNNSSMFKFVDLDYKLEDGKGDSYQTIHDVVADETVNVSGNFEEEDFFKFISKNLNEIEVDLVEVLIGEKRDIEVAKKFNKSKSRISKIKSDMIKKLQVLVEDYNSTNTNNQLSFF